MPPSNFSLFHRNTFTIFLSFKNTLIFSSGGPIREKLDKIYDINVTFVARDDNTLIAYA
jgi:hypothetical protein